MKTTSQHTNMKKKITSKVDNYMIEFKSSIKDYFQNNDINIVDEKGDNQISEFLKFVYDYKSIEFDNDDFQNENVSRTKSQISIAVVL